jgi:hypothetical protein
MLTPQQLLTEDSALASWAAGLGDFRVRARV